MVLNIKMFQREFWESVSVGEGVLHGMRLVIQSPQITRSYLRIQPSYEGMLPDGSVLEQWTVSIVWWFRLPPKSGPNVFMVQSRNKNKIKHKSWSYNKGMSSRWKSCKVVQVFPIFMSQLVLKFVSAIFIKFYFFTKW